MINNVTLAERLSGMVAHSLRDGDVSTCGRMVTHKGMARGERRLCRTCVRLNPAMRALSDRERKTARDAALRASVDVSAMGESADISWEYELSEGELAATLAKIEKINARAAKRGIPGALNVEWREEIKREKNDIGIEIERVVFPTKITGIAPKFNDWIFIATLDFDQHAGLIVRTYPGQEGIDRASMREGWCDHCQTDRYRRSTYVMRNTRTGEQIQVGSTCIKDFTGWTALPVSFDSMRKDMEELEGGYGHGGGYDPSVRTVLAVAWACITARGWVPKSAYEGQPTAYLVRDVINPPKPDSRNGDYIAELRAIMAESDGMYERADMVRAFILSDAFVANSEFSINLKSIAGAERVSGRNFAMLCYAPQAWAKHNEKTFVKEREAKPVSQWIGEIGERWELSLTIKATKFIESQYGCTTLHIMEDASGNVFKWFASNADYTDEIGGEAIRFNVGIKAHQEYKGSHDTLLTRVREIESAETESKMVKGAPIKVRSEIKATDLGELSTSDVYLFGTAYYRIRIQKGTAYAVKHTADGWQYAEGMVKNLTAFHKLSASEAAFFGQSHGQCVYCSKALTDERSMAVGYGKDCAASHGLPWGE